MKSLPLPVALPPLFTQALSAVAIPVIFFAALAACFIGTRVDGDGGEYFMTSVAFYRHLSPDIRPEDFAELKAIPPEKAQRAGIPQLGLLEVPGGLAHGQRIYMGFAKDARGEIRSIHFWLYSALAAPLCAVTSALKVSPAYAFTALNGILIVLTLFLLLKWIGPRPKQISLFLLSTGTLFYLRWTGPEVLTACAILLATISLLRRDYSLAILFSGIAASQNPSAIVLVPATVCYYWLARCFPGLAILPAKSRSNILTGAAVAGGVITALAPYGYSYIHFGVPSIIAQYYTSSSLVSVTRAVSFFLDPNQGLIVGLPAVFISVLICVHGLPSNTRMQWTIHVIFALILLVAMAVPTFTTTNWNSGYALAIRYGYWASMPIVALCVATFPQQSEKRLTLIFLASITLQVTAAWQARWPAGGYLQNTRFSNLLLNKFPSTYNPEPEIFLEREFHKERMFTPADIAVHYYGAVPTKIIRHVLNDEWVGSGLCGEGQLVVASSVSDSARGWVYHNGPFTCEPDRVIRRAWNLGRGTGNVKLLGEGWSGIEDSGVWTDGERSAIVLDAGANANVQSIILSGYYLVPGERTRVFINGSELGVFALDRQLIAIPKNIASQGGKLNITLQNLHPTTPAQLGLSSDARKLSFFLEEAKIAFTPDVRN